MANAQQRDVQAIFDRMSAGAKPLGGEVIAQEQAQDDVGAASVSHPAGREPVR